MCQRVMANPDDNGAPKEGGGGGDERFRVSCNWRRPFAEMRNDLNRRRPHYLSDWTDAYTRKVVSSALFMFFTSIAPGITFSALLGDQTRVDGRAELGPVEVILSTAVTGSIFAIFGALCSLGASAFSRSVAAWSWAHVVLSYRSSAEAASGAAAR